MKKKTEKIKQNGSFNKKKKKKLLTEDKGYK